ncbi:hypothetical protein NEOC65_002460 [Neochlamydia sp. AcF65]|nr:hypothetical protein [Neochlamydia sp. AcF65]NGY94950.1 hypothetical protein [Neochlamydia sp. AcF84]
MKKLSLRKSTAYTYKINRLTMRDLIQKKKEKVAIKDKRLALLFLFASYFIDRL